MVSFLFFLCGSLFFITAHAFNCHFEISAKVLPSIFKNKIHFGTLAVKFLENANLVKFFSFLFLEKKH